MIIARQKRKENIAEYMLYMYQVEDLIRASNLDPARIEQTIINKFDVPYDTRREMLEWYKSLISMMREEGKTMKGHLDFLNRIADEMNQLHVNMLNNVLEQEYREAWENARPNIELLRMRSGHTGEHDIQVMLNGVYGLLMLRLQKKEITKETEKAFDTITNLIALLSVKFSEHEQS